MRLSDVMIVHHWADITIVTLMFVANRLSLVIVSAVEFFIRVKMMGVMMMTMMVVNWLVFSISMGRTKEVMHEWETISWNWFSTVTFFNAWHLLSQDCLLYGVN